MGVLDWFPCCGPRDKSDKIAGPSSESRPILEESSVFSVEGSVVNYGATDASTQSGLTGEQRHRIEEIGREVGGHMLPISQPHARTSPSQNKHLHKTNTIDSTTSSAPSSRPSSPSPMRPDTSPPGGVIQTPEKPEGGGEGGAGAGAGAGEGDDTEVVKKSLFGAGGLGVRGGRRGKRGRGGGGSRETSRRNSNSANGNT